MAWQTSLKPGESIVIAGEIKVQFERFKDISNEVALVAITGDRSPRLAHLWVGEVITLSHLVASIKRVGDTDISYGMPEGPMPSDGLHLRCAAPKPVTFEKLDRDGNAVTLRGKAS